SACKLARVSVTAYPWAVAAGGNACKEADHVHQYAASSAPQGRRWRRRRRCRSVDNEPRSNAYTSQRFQLESRFPRVSEGLLLGRGYRVVSDRRSLERGWQGTIDLGHVRAHARQDGERRYRRRGDRPLSPLQG